MIYKVDVLIGTCPRRFCEKICIDVAQVGVDDNYQYFSEVVKHATTCCSQAGVQNVCVNLSIFNIFRASRRQLQIRVSSLFVCKGLASTYATLHVDNFFGILGC